LESLTGQSQITRQNSSVAHFIFIMEVVVQELLEIFECLIQ